MSDRINIALNALKTNGVNIEHLNQSVMGCDYVATLQEQSNTPFLVYISSSALLRTEAYKEYVESFQEIKEVNDKDKLPILLLLVNEKEESVMMGIFLYWIYERSFVNTKPNFRKVNAKNLIWLSDCLHGLYRIISFVNVDNLRIVKYVKLNDERWIDAYVIYTRNLTNTYRMKEKNPQLSDFERNLNGTPQNEYPSDILDEFIYEEIKKSYPNAEMFSSSYFFGLDIINLEQYKTYAFTTNTISVIPVYYHPITNQLMQLDSNVLNISLDIVYHPNYRNNFGDRPILNNLVKLEDVSKGCFSELQQKIDTYHQLSKEWM